ncbi:MAG: bifunctional pyr operon transcriptional regulator/uracil phosphoribosyltransferase PyrR [Clostridia bacterium]|nr:bifunctional pyr operon transcriptional regulator/uracil phosphoribosyltransferase PyrR [Clostridia bacterium]
MKVKAVLLEGVAIDRALTRIAHEIVERNKGVENVVLLGIARGGVPICQRLANNIFNVENVSVPTGTIDITLYRDDKKVVDTDAKVNDSKINFSLQDKDVVLCDDVLFTGRTVRAGIEALFKFGRPRSIQLAVLIDRGHRELPFKADYVGKNVPTSRNEEILVTFDAESGNKAVIVDGLK